MKDEDEFLNVPVVDRCLNLAQSGVSCQTPSMQYAMRCDAMRYAQSSHYAFLAKHHHQLPLVNRFLCSPTN